MLLNQVTPEDGKACAYLLNFIKAGRWELSGDQAEQLLIAKRWLAGLAQEMASQLKTKPAQAPAGPMKVKNMGPIGSGPKKKAKRK